MWFAAGDATLCVFLVTSTAAAVEVAFELDMAATYPLAGGGSEDFDVFLLAVGGGSDKLVTRVRGSSVVTLKRTVAGRSVEMLEVRKAS